MKSITSKRKSTYFSILGWTIPFLKVSLVSFLSKFCLKGVSWGAHRMSQCKQSCCISCSLLIYLLIFFALDLIQQHSSELKPLHSFKLLGGSSWRRRVSSNSDTAKSNGCFSPWTIMFPPRPPGWYFSCAWNDTVQVEIEEIEFRRSGHVRSVKVDCDSRWVATGDVGYNNVQNCEDSRNFEVKPRG